MHPMSRLLRAFAADSSGATAIEYALIATLVSVAVVAGATQIGTALSAKFNAVKSNLS